MSDDNRPLWIGIGIALFVAVIAIVSFSLLVVILNNNSNGSLNDRCDDSNNCDGGFVCSDGYCKSVIGNNCTVIEDCGPEATVCLNNICSGEKLGVPGEKPPCQRGLLIRNNICVSQVGGICKNDSQCAEGNRCMDGICINKVGEVGEQAPCKSGLVVSEGICKLPDGDCCIKDYQCISGSVCDIEIHEDNIPENGICTPIPKTGQICTPIGNICGYGDTCSKSVVLNTFGDNLYPEVNESIIDLAQIFSNAGDLLLEKDSKSYSYNHYKGDLGEVVLLLQDGNFILSNKGRLKFIQSEIAMKNIISFEDNLYGISSGVNINNGRIGEIREGILYKLKDECRRSMKWKWEIQNWAPNNIVHLSATNNGKYFWLQSLPVLNTSTSKGYLYRVRTSDEIDQGLMGPVLEQKFNLKDYSIRNYGNNILSYVQFSPKTGDGILYPRKLVLSNVFYGILLLDGSLFSIGRDEKNKFKLTRMINSAGVYITHRICEQGNAEC